MKYYQFNPKCCVLARLLQWTILSHLSNTVKLFGDYGKSGVYKKIHIFIKDNL